jgi:L-asparaginase / beta-aspartyl-peptidase
MQISARVFRKRIPHSAFRVPRSKKNPKSLGTVGAVACDTTGNLAAATSTGGMTNKKFGRVGDTALIGSGTYADNGTCAVSCTGHGEFFMMGVTAYDVAARMKYRGIDLLTAAKQAIEHLTDLGGEGGFIAVDANGNVALPFNSDGMYRGYYTADGEMSIEIYR